MVGGEVDVTEGDSWPLALTRRPGGGSGRFCFVIVPAYASLAVAMGKIDTLLQPVPDPEPGRQVRRVRQRGVLGASSPAAATGR